MTLDFDFTATDLTSMRDMQDAHMQDTCVIQACTQTKDSYGQLVETFTDGSAIACGLDMRSGSERRNVENVLLTYDATLRLDITQAPAVIDRIKVTKRFGEALDTALIFGIQGPIQRGPSGIRLLLERIET